MQCNIPWLQHMQALTRIRRMHYTNFFCEVLLLSKHILVWFRKQNNILSCAIWQVLISQSWVAISSIRIGIRWFFSFQYSWKVKILKLYQMHVFFKIFLVADSCYISSASIIMSQWIWYRVIFIALILFPKITWKKEHLCTSPSNTGVSNNY